MVDLGRQQKDFGVLELYKTRAMGSFPEMRYEETEVWTKDATGNPVSKHQRSGALEGSGTPDAATTAD